jgi:hypothetical protein
VAIDDEQWLERASARALAFAWCRLRDEPAGVLLARRVVSEGALWPALARGFGAGALATVTLNPLDLEAIDEVLAWRLDRTFSRPLLRRIHGISGGNPLYAVAIACDRSVGTGECWVVARTPVDGGWNGPEHGARSGHA